MDQGHQCFDRFEDAMWKIKKDLLTEIQNNMGLFEFFLGLFEFSTSPYNGHWIFCNGF